MLTGTDLAKIYLGCLAISFIVPVTLGVIDHWRWHPPLFWTRFRRFLTSWRKLPW